MLLSMEAPSPTPDIVVLSACRVDLARQVVERDGRVQRLRTKEAQLLAYFLSHPATEISRDELLTEVWGYRAGIVTRTVDNTVRRLRCCIEANPDEPDHVITVYGVGYRFVPPAPRATASRQRPRKECPIERC